MSKHKTILDIVDLIEAADTSAFDSFRPEAQELINTLAAATASYADQAAGVKGLGLSGAAWDYAYNQVDAALAGGESACRDLFLALVHQCFEVGQPSDAQELLPDDGGRCIHLEGWWTLGTVWCAPTPNCVKAGLGPMQGEYLTFGWCYETLGQGCKCEKRKLHVGVLIALLAVAALMFSPASIGAIKVILARFAPAIAA